MITVTNTAPTNTLTPLASPVVDNAQTTQTNAQATVSQEGFSSALNDQMNLAAPISSAEVTNTPLLASANLAVTVANAVTISVDTPAVDASTIVDPAGMSEQDTAILSTVTDTLKFISSGTKLGDTLPAGQSIQLPNANLSSTLTQQTVQSAVNQAVTQIPVTTSADILAKQVTPVQVATSTTVDTESSKSSAVLAAINISSEQNVGLNANSSPNNVPTTNLLQGNASSNSMQNQNVAQQASSNQVMTQTAADAQASVQEKTTLTTAGFSQGTTIQQIPVDTKITQQQSNSKPNTVALTQNSVLNASMQQDTLNQTVVAQSNQTPIENTALVGSQTAQSLSLIHI